MAYFTRILDRALLRISGPETRPFLQGLVSVDVVKITPEKSAYGFLLTPQGRFLHDMFIIADGDDLLLDTAKDTADLLLKRLGLFKLKRDVAITPCEDWQIACYWSPEEVKKPLFKSASISQDPRLPALGYRIYSSNAVALEGYDLSAEHAEISVYAAYRISLGVPESIDFISEKSFPLDFDMDDLCAIDYKKGCYIGQEVTARMHFKAVPRKGIYIVGNSSAGSLPERGTEVISKGMVAGMLLSVSSNQALALLKHDMVMHQPSGTIHASGIPLKIKRPFWAKNISNLMAEGQPEGVS